MRVCANPHCSEPSMSVNPSLRCMNCESYRKRHGEERPPRLVRWPANGHPLLTSTGLSKLTRITYRRLDHAVRAGWLRPTIDVGGSGHSRGFTFADAIRTVVGFECAGLPDHLRDEAVATCSEVDRIALDVGSFGSKLVIDVAHIREHLDREWPNDAERDLDDETRAIVLGPAVAA